MKIMKDFDKSTAHSTRWQTTHGSGPLTTGTEVVRRASCGGSGRTEVSQDLENNTHMKTLPSFR